MPTGTRVHAGRYVRGRLDSGEPGGEAAIRPEQLRCFDERRRGIGLAGLASDVNTVAGKPRRADWRLRRNQSGFILPKS